ncbi:MAG: sigma-70 family RNA polymerase sigma factor [Bacteroidales bacterium]|nr:sigma-70 family RNA polymerase sigma factor [Bacteroidales bacterium]MCF8456523.1 sigma-70 family RNA polymerase sigma factor [Bacteroidales bacterium]
MTEEQLIQGCKTRKHQAQKALYDKHANVCYRLCYRYLGNDQDAEDALITGFNKIFEKIDGFENRNTGGFRAWIKKIMVNECLMTIRRRSHFDHEEFQEGSTPSESFNYLELDAELIYKCIANLNESQRTIFNLFVLEGYSHQEIANELLISRATSMSQLSRAKKELQEKLKEYKSDYYG